MNVGGTNYDVTTFQGSYDTDTAKFATPANGGVMPWWGDFNLARAFATAIADQLGRPNLISGPLPFGPLFAYSKFFNNGADQVNWVALTPGTNVTFLGTLPAEVKTFAQVVPSASTAVPGPLPVFGAAAAFGMSRRLRRRIQLGA